MNLEETCEALSRQLEQNLGRDFYFLFPRKKLDGKYIIDCYLYKDADETLVPSYFNLYEVKYGKLNYSIFEEDEPETRSERWFEKNYAIYQYIKGLVGYSLISTETIYSKDTPVKVYLNSDKQIDKIPKTFLGYTFEVIVQEPIIPAGKVNPETGDVEFHRADPNNNLWKVSDEVIEFEVRVKEEKEMNIQENKDKLEKIIKFYKEKALKLTFQNWIILGLLFLYVDAFRGLVLAGISVAFLLNFFMLSAKDKNNE